MHSGWVYSYVVAREVVDSGLGQHAVVCTISISLLFSLSLFNLFDSGCLTLELRLAERRGVAGDDDELGLARAESLEGRLVSKCDLTGLWKSVRICSMLSTITIACAP
jgi:hypothetical protein